MNITIDLKMLTLVIVIIAVVILVVYLVRVLKRLMATLEHTNKILEDVEVISDIAANRSKDLDGIIDNISESTSNLSEAVKGKQNIISAVTSVIKAAATLKNVISKEDKE